MAMAANNKAHGSFLSGTDLLYVCTEDFKGWEDRLCALYVEGASDGIGVSAHYFSDGSLPFCAPDRFTGTQLRKVVLKYLDEHPEELHLAATGLIMTALIEAFPCEP